MDSKYPTIIGQKNKAEFHGYASDSQMNYPILPRGVMREENDMDFKEPRLLRTKENFEAAATPFYSEEDI
jgi:hypothetical protein